MAIFKAATGETGEVSAVGKAVIELADGDPQKGNLLIVSPLSLALMVRALARLFLGKSVWKHDVERGAAMSRDYPPVGYPQY